jgi:hypothetical protein
MKVSLNSVSLYSFTRSRPEHEGSTELAKFISGEDVAFSDFRGQGVHPYTDLVEGCANSKSASP